DSVEFARDVFVTTVGEVLVVGDKFHSSGSGFHEVVAKFDPIGNLVWAKNILPFASSPMSNTTKLKVFARGDSVFVFATGWTSTYDKDIFLTVLSLADGSPLAFFAYDELFSEDVLLDVVMIGSEFVISCYD